VDAVAATVKRHGGQVVSAPRDIPVGRIATVMDPQGATLALFHPSGPPKGGATEFHWNELWSPNAKASITFYEKALGLDVDTMDMPGQKEPYYLLKRGETLVGGVLSPPIRVPPMWLAYVKVDDLDATLARASARGGELVGPVQSVPNVGRFGIVKQPAGPPLGYITPARGD